jgi:hypothetical protein
MAVHLAAGAVVVLGGARVGVPGEKLIPCINVLIEGGIRPGSPRWRMKGST